MSQRVTFLTVSQAATALGVNPWTLRRLESRGVVPAAPRATLSKDRYYSEEHITEAAVALVRHRLGVAA